MLLLHIIPPLTATKLLAKGPGLWKTLTGLRTII